MNATALLRQAQAAGITLRLADGQLKVRGTLRILHEWAPRLRPVKRELVELLRQATVNESWPLESPDRDSVREAFEERAAIQEFDGGLKRAEAEFRAAREVGWLHEGSPCSVASCNEGAS